MNPETGVDYKFLLTPSTTKKKKKGGRGGGNEFCIFGAGDGFVIDNS